MLRPRDAARTSSLLFAGLVLSGCSLLFGSELDGLGPYPPEDATDVSDAPRQEAGGADVDGAVADPRDAPDAATDQGDADRSDAAELNLATDNADAPADADAPLDGADPAREDASPGDGAPADARSFDHVDPDVTDGDTPGDGAPDADAPPGDGRIVGLGSWVLSGSGKVTPSNYEVRGWMIPTTSLRGTTRSGLTIEGWLQ